jgi:hypothetical protein
MEISAHGARKRMVRIENMRIPPGGDKSILQGAFSSTKFQIDAEMLGGPSHVASKIGQNGGFTKWVVFAKMPHLSEDGSSGRWGTRLYGFDQNARSRSDLPHLRRNISRSPRNVGDGGSTTHNSNLNLGAPSSAQSHRA